MSPNYVLNDKINCQFHSVSNRLVRCNYWWGAWLAAAGIDARDYCGRNTFMDQPQSVGARSIIDCWITVTVHLIIIIDLSFVL